MPRPALSEPPPKQSLRGTRRRRCCELEGYRDPRGGERCPSRNPGFNTSHELVKKKHATWCQHKLTTRKRTPTEPTVTIIASARASCSTPESFHGTRHWHTSLHRRVRSRQEDRETRGQCSRHGTAKLGKDNRCLGKCTKRMYFHPFPNALSSSFAQPCLLDKGGRLPKRATIRAMIPQAP